MDKVFISDIKWKYIFKYFSNTKSLFRHYQELMLKDCGKYFKGEVIEIGGEKHYNTQQFFPGITKYQVSNIDRDYDIYLDVTRLALPDNSVDNYVMVSVLQHVDDPMAAVNELGRTLKPGGYLILANAYTHPLCDTYDYWRFSEVGYEMLLKKGFEIVKIYKLGGKYSSFANTFQRPRQTRSIRVFINKIIGVFVGVMGKVLEIEDLSPLGIGVLARKKLNITSSN